MTYKTLLTHVEPDWGSGRALAVAVQLAQRFGAHLIGLGAEQFAPVNYAFADGAVVQMLRDQIDADAVTARQRFDVATKALGAACSWVTTVDAPVTAMAACARGADLVIARRTRQEAGEDNLCRIEALVADAGAPVLVVTDDDRPVKADKVVVAWRDGPQARRALIDALPFLTSAAEVRLVEVCPGAEQGERQRQMTPVRDRLARLGVTATTAAVIDSGQAVAHELERVAATMGADLIVAGAYSHRRFQEWVLGGVTQDLALGSPCHVLFSR
jgi:nucleotide-binding universal stress UspA family protein